MATNAPALVHPPQQSVRPSALPSDRSHTDKWLQVRAARRGAQRLPHSLTLAWQKAPSRSPQEWVASMTPIEVKTGSVARCYGGA